MNNNEQQMKNDLRQPLKIFVLSLITSIFLLLQLIMPRIGLSLIPNFDTSCYSGSIAFIERVSSGSSCGGGGSGHIGFPFVMNFSYNSKLENLLAVLFNAAILTFLYAVAIYLISLSKQKPKKKD